MEDNKQLVEIKNEVSAVTKNISSIKTEIAGALNDNQTSARRCVEAGETLLARAESAMDDALDVEIANYIKKSKATVKAMGERRKTVTQVFDMVKKGFTKLEGFLDVKNEDSILFRLQKKRDEWVAYKIEQQRKAEEERLRMVRINTQKEQVAADTRKVCMGVLSLRQQEAVKELRERFQQMTLENKDETKGWIEGYKDELKIAGYLKHSTEDDKNEWGALDAIHITVDNYLEAVYPDLSEEEVRTGRNEAYKSCHKEYEEQYKSTIDATKTELLDAWDSKVTELEEAKRLEEERKKKEEEARKAAEEAKKIADEKARIEAEAEAARKAEEAKKAEIERKRHEEEVRAQEEAAQREQEERLKQEAEARAQEEKIKAAQSQAQSLFDQTSVGYAIKAKVSKHIEIDDASGYIDIMQMWWTHEGAMMDKDKLAKKLGFMVKVCEQLANKDGITIKNDKIRYVEDIVAK